MIPSRFIKTRKLLKDFEKNAWKEVRAKGYKGDSDKIGKDYDSAIEKQVTIINTLLEEAGNSCMSASFVCLGIVKKVYGIETPYMILHFGDFVLYPQFDGKITNFIEVCKPKLIEIAKRKIKENKRKDVHSEVMKRWKEIAKGNFDNVRW